MRWLYFALTVILSYLINKPIRPARNDCKMATVRDGNRGEHLFIIAPRQQKMTSHQKAYCRSQEPLVKSALIRAIR